MEKKAIASSLPEVGGVFLCELVRDGKVIDVWSEHNLVPTEGLNKLLDSAIGGAAQVTTWYVAPFEGNYTPVAGDTAATIVASATECTTYTEATRAAYTPAAADAGSITNTASKATFTFNASKTIYGCFITSASAKSATTGALLSAARFAASKSVTSGDQLQVTYVFTATSA